MSAIVQSVSASAASGPTIVAVMPGDVTAGNTLVIVTGHKGGNECSSANPLDNAVFTDTRSLTFTSQVTAQNVNGAQASSCIITAPITSSGPETITRTIVSSNYPASMWVAEVSGIFSPTAVTTNAGTANSATSVGSGNVTSAAPSLVLVGGAAGNDTPVFDGASPSGSTTNFSADGTNAALIKFVPAGTYACVFDKSGGGVRMAASAAIFTVGDLVTGLSDTLAFSDAGATNRGYLFSEGLAFSDFALDSVTGAAAGGDLVGDFINLKDSATATFGFFPPGGQRGNIDYDQIRLSARAGTGAKLHTLTGSVTTGHTVVFDANGNLIDAGAAPGTGTVSSVAMTVPTGFTIGGSPVTASGTLALGLSTETANTVWAGPTTGAAATPTFRAIVEADLPLGSSSAFGAVKVDNTTITASAGVISAVAGTSPALVLREQHTASTSASLSFTTFYSSAYDEYMIEIVNLIPDTNNIQGLITLSTDGGSTYSTTTYYARLLYFFAAATPGYVNGATSSWPFTGTTLSSDTHLGAIATMKLFSPGSASLYKMLTGECVYYDGTNDLIKVSISARWSTATAVNAIKFTPSSGNWLSGTIRIYGILK